MNVKIQGGGTGEYANTGSCVGVTNYLAHEDIERVNNGQQQEYFFTHDKAQVSDKEVSYKIDSNKAKLCKTESKFFVLTISPSKEEIQAMGATQQEQAAAFKNYINNGVMERYAENFGKGLTGKDLMYYAKIHYTRNGKTGEQMHAHILVSRKDITNTIKLSPQTNHKKAGKGAVKSGFSRDDFFRNCELSFDQEMRYNRDFTQSYDFRNTMKNKPFAEIKNLDQVKKKFDERMRKLLLRKPVMARQQEREQEQERSRGMRR